MVQKILKSSVGMALAGLAVVVLLSLSVSIVPETSQALITSYGQYKRTVNPYRKGDTLGATTQAGLTFRIPFVEQIQYIDKRVLSVEMAPQEVLSTDQLQVQVNAFARYRITDTLKMYRTLRTEDALNARLGETLGSSVRNELGKRSFATLLSAERGQVMANIRKQLNLEANRYGATIIDVRIKRADLPEGTPLDSAYERMRSAREQERATIEAEGRRDAQFLRADGEAEAARIYAESFGKDAEFYDFYRSMQSYRKTFAKGDGQGDTSVVLSPNNDYLRNFRDGR
ncbi:MAG: protease modulator HflC [Sphingorhabdus sp.]